MAEELLVIKFRRTAEIMAKLMNEIGYDVKNSDDGKDFYLDVRYMKEDKLECVGRIRMNPDNYKWHIDIYPNSVAQEFRKHTINLANALFGSEVGITWESKTS